MNRIYKVIWNSETEQWVAASELAHAKGKSKSKNLKRLAALGLCGMLAGTAAAAIPEGVAQSPTDVAVGTGSEAKGTYSTAYGETAKANTVFATALGSSAQAQGQSAIAIGREANAQSDDTVAVGGKAAAAATNAVVVGKEASVRAATSADLPSGITAAQTGATAGTGSVAVGANAKAYGTNATTIGQSSNALGQNSLAGGQAAKAYGKSSVALGDGALASNDAAAAVGTSAQATAGGTAALGYAANAAGFGAAALGRQAQALGTGDISIGDNAGKNRKDFGTNYGGAGLYYSDGLLSSAAAASVATHTNIALGKEAAVNSGGIRNIAIGSGAGTSHFGEDSISIGTNANNFKANGAADGTKTDTPTRARHTIAVGQNAMTYGENSIALGNGAKTTNFKYNTGAATPSYTSASRAMAIGESSDASGTFATAFGFQAKTERNDSTAIGKQAKILANPAGNAATLGNHLAIGNESLVGQNVGSHATVVGYQAQAVGAGNNKLAVGTRAVSSGTIASAVGVGAKAHGDTTSAYGSYTQVSGGFDSMAAGSSAAVVSGSGSSTASSQAAIGSGSITAAKGAVSVGTGTMVFGENSASIGANGGGSAARMVQALANGKMDDTVFSIIGGKNNQSVGNRNLIGSTSNNNTVFGNDIKVGASAASVTSEEVEIDTADGKVKHTNYKPAFTNTKNIDSAVAVGNAAKVGDSNTVAVGKAAEAAGLSSTAIGETAAALKQNGIAIGKNAKAGTSAATASSDSDAVAIGTDSTAYEKDTVALGNTAKATADSATALGKGAKASQVYATAVGLDTVADGNSALAAGSGAAARANSATAVGNDAQALGTDASAFGRDAQAAEEHTVAVGSSTRATAAGAIAVGNDAQATAADAAAVGKHSRASATRATAAGNSANAAGVSSVAVGDNAQAQNDYAVSIGAGSAASAIAATAIGNDAKAKQWSSVALGRASETADAVATTAATVGGISYNGFAGTAPEATVSIGSDTVKRTLTNLAAGRIAADSTDAVNGSQLYAVADTLGGKLTHYYSVKSAETGAGSNYDNDGATGSNALAAGVKASASALNTVAVGFNAQAGKDGAVSVGADTQASNASTALGNKATATGENSTALGWGANAAGRADVFIGKQSGAGTENANNFSNIGIGEGAVKDAGKTAAVTNIIGIGTGAGAGLETSHNIALGAYANNSTITGTSVTGSDNIAIGQRSVASGGGSIAVGNKAQASVLSAVAVGLNAAATGAQAVAVGRNTQAAGAGSVAVGGSANDGKGAAAKGSQSVAIGQLSSASNTGAAALGVNAQAAHQKGVALGYESETDTNVTTTQATVNGIAYSGFAGAANANVSIGKSGFTRTLTNLAAGRISTTSTDAVNGSQLYAVADTLGGKLTHYYSVNSTATGAGSNYNNDGATGTDALAAGAGASAKQMSSVAIGKNAVADGDNSQSDSVAIGTAAKASGNASLAIGPGASTSGSDSLGGIAIGAAASSQNGGLSLGSGADSGNGTALIPGLPVRLNNNVALGDSATVKNDTNFRVALGSMSIAGVSDLGTDPYKPSANASVKGIAESGVTLGEVSVGGDNRAGQGEILYRRITNLAAGSADTDAVNVSQLKALADARSKVAGSGLASVSSATDSAGATTYTVNVAQAAAPTVTRGNVAVAAADAGKVMTAGDVAAAINNSEKTSSVVAGSTAVSVSAGSEDAAGNTQYTVDLGTAAKASLGKADSALQNIRSGSPNLSVAKNGDTVTVGMSTTPAFTSVTTGDTVLNSGGLTIAPAGKTPVVLNSDGLNNGGNKITNVAAGNISAASTDAVNGSQLYALGEKPLTFTGDSGSVRRKLGETLAVKGDGTYVSTKAENGGVNISVSENAVRDTARKAVDVKGEGVITVTPSQDNTAHTTTYTVKYDGGKAAAATDIAYTANGGTVRKTSLAKGFNFSNGANTTAEVGADGIVKFNAVTGSIATTGGKAAVAAADAGKLATAGDVAEAVNNAAWKVTAKADGGELESGASVESVKAGDQVGLQVGKNLKLKQNGKNFTYLLNDTLTGLNSASFGGGAGKPSAVIDGSGVRITPAGGGKAVSLTDKGLDNGGQTIANVASGGSTETNAANIGDVKKAAAAAKNTVSAGDANVTVTPKAFSDGHTDYAVKLADKLSLGKGKVSLDGTGGDISAANSIKAGNTITAGQGANAVAIDGTKAEVKAGKVTVNGKDGHITGLANTTWVSGQTAPVSGRAATEDQLKAVDNQVAQNKTDIAKLSGNIGQGLNFAGNTGSVNKKLGSTVNIVGEGTKADSRYSGENVKTMVDANGNLVVKTDKDLKAESLTLAKDGKTGVAITTDNGAGNISLNGANGAKTDIAAAKGAAVLGGSAQADRIRYTGSDGTSREAATMDDGMRYGGDNLASDGTIDKKLNQRLDIVGGADKAKLSDNNIGVNKDSQGRLKVQLSKELNSLSSASFADGSGNTAVVNGAGSTVRDSAGNQTAVGAGGVSITPASGNAVSLGGGGLDNGGNKITNVAAGEKATDAVNVGQLNAKLGAITEAANLNFNALEHKIDNVGETANAGVAGAIAQGSIPQVTRPGASGLGVGSGYYGGQSALAVGMSSMSDGGNWIVKGNISVNTKGRVGAGAGALYQW
ncbi:YadA-like family protein [Neisseria bacilliformis]|uniref:YadA-like family protein n=1 Tax=Neisseria bacilliformis TaxID=267212 RepID=UPI0028E8F874|nr:YadA-like family protein [Neisseria bacilliformis]